MKTIITTEEDILNHKDPLPTNVTLVHFKMIGVGPNTMERANYLGSAICEIVNQQSGFFILSEDDNSFREAMHDLVNRFCDAKEGKI